jgi:16S rRNA (adenine1518-N6/adenine1519-N6)-dimethyltransferase
VTLTAGQLRRLADELGVQPTKRRGQNFVVDPNTVRRIVRQAQVEPGDVVLEVGPGLGSLTLALLEAGAHVVAVEVDDALAAALPATVAEHAGPHVAPRLRVVAADALTLSSADLEPWQPTALCANLPYNVAVPILLHLLPALPSLQRATVMVQAEVAARLTAQPGSRVYGVPTVKLAWDVAAAPAGPVPRGVFWPVPNVDSALVRLQRRPAAGLDELRRPTFTLVDAAFGQRRKTLRAALAGTFGSPQAAEAALRAADIDPGARAEQLDVHAFVRLAHHLAGPNR